MDLIIIFNEQASLTGSSEFAGAPLKESIDYIVDGYNRGFNNKECKMLLLMFLIIEV